MPPCRRPAAVRTRRVSSAMTMKKSADITDAPSARPGGAGLEPVPARHAEEEREPSEDQRRARTPWASPGGPRPASQDASATHTGATKTSSTTVGPARGTAPRTRPAPRPRRPRPPRLRWPAREVARAGRGCAAQRRAQHERGHQQAHAEQRRRARAELVRPPGEHGHRPEAPSPQRARRADASAPRQGFQRAPTRTSINRRVLGMRRERASLRPAAREIVAASWELSRDDARS